MTYVLYFICTGFSKILINKTSTLASVRCCCQSQTDLFSCETVAEPLRQSHECRLTQTAAFPVLRCLCAVCKAGTKSTFGDINSQWWCTYRCVAGGNDDGKWEHAHTAASRSLDVFKTVLHWRMMSWGAHSKPPHNNAKTTSTLVSSKLLNLSG